MAWGNLEKEMQQFFNSVSNGVREDMDNRFVHWVDINYRSAATGFHKAAIRISGDQNYLPNGKQIFVNIVKKICQEWATGKPGTTPGDVFRTVKMIRGPQAGTTRYIGISNARVVKETAGAVTVQIAVPEKSGEIKTSTFLKNFRKSVWEEFNEYYKQQGKGPLKSTTVWQDTNFGHSEESTVGLRQMRKLGATIDKSSPDYNPNNPFQDVEDQFSGKIAKINTTDMLKFVQKAVGGNLSFSYERVNGKQVQVVKGRIDPGNYAGSEKTDKRSFNKYIKEYYKKTFNEHFNANEGKAKVLKSWGMTAHEFKSSRSFTEDTQDVIVNLVGDEFKKVRGSKVKTVKKPKRKKLKKSVKPRKRAVGSAVGTSSTKRVNNARRATPWRNKAGINPIGLAELLNKTLAKELMKNMGPYPRRLENRTGRFARSAEVTNIAPLPNSVEIQYTYQKDPYSVFEPEFGNAMASHGRDPKRLIGGTIREIAQSIMGTRFGLVRTKRV